MLTRRIFLGSTITMLASCGDSSPPTYPIDDYLATWTANPGSSARLSTVFEIARVEAYPPSTMYTDAAIEKAMIIEARWEEFGNTLMKTATGYSEDRILAEMIERLTGATAEVSGRHEKPGEVVRWGELLGPMGESIDYVARYRGGQRQGQAVVLLASPDQLSALGGPAAFGADPTRMDEAIFNDY